MKTVKEAAVALLSRGEITQDQFNLIEKNAGFIDVNFKALQDAYKASRSSIKNFAFDLSNKPLHELVSNGAQKGADALAGAIKPAIKYVNPVGVGLAATAAAATVAKEMFIDPAAERNKINTSYDQIVEKTPALAGEDQSKIRDYFDVVKSFSPHAAANPLVAGSLVNKMVQFGGVDHKLVQDMVSIQEGKSSEGYFPHVLKSGIKSLTEMKGDKGEHTGDSNEAENTSFGWGGM